MPDQGNVQSSSLRQAVDRILGFSPGGSGGQQGGQSQQTSDFLLGAKPMMSDISSIRNVIDTPVEPPKDTAALSNPVTPAPASAVSSAPSTGTDPNAALYSWTTPREREAAAAAAAQGIDYWGTTSPESRKASFASEDAYKNYAFKGHEWNDPLAKQIYMQFNPNSGRAYDQALYLADEYYKNPSPGSVNHSFINPMDWGGAYQGDTYNQMKNAYTKAGGLAYGVVSPYGH